MTSPVLQRPPEETYIRTSITTELWCLEPAIEYREGDSYEALMHHLDLMARHVGASESNTNVVQVAREMAGHIKQWQPDRAYFVEVWPVEGPGFCQVYQPYGIPRWR